MPEGKKLVHAVKLKITLGTCAVCDGSGPNLIRRRPQETREHTDIDRFVLILSAGDRSAETVVLFWTTVQILVRLPVLYVL